MWILALETCLCTWSAFPISLTKNWSFISEIPLVFDYSHFHLLSTFFWDKILHLIRFILKSGLWLISLPPCVCVYRESKILQKPYPLCFCFSFLSVQSPDQNFPGRDGNEFPSSLTNINTTMILKETLEALITSQWLELKGKKYHSYAKWRIVCWMIKLECEDKLH